MNNQENYYYKVHVSIASMISSIDGVFHIKWEKDLMKVIQCREFVFATTNMALAIERIKFLTENHPDGYFNRIEINYKKSYSI